MLQFDEVTARLLEEAYQGADVRRRRRMAFDALHLAPFDTVVDIGCGNGLLTEEIGRALGAAGHVIGVDPSPDMRGLAEARCAAMPGVRIVDGVADALPLGEGAADTAVAVQVLEYLDDIPAVVREVHRVLRRGGRFVAVDTGCGTLDWFSEAPDRMAQMQQAWDHHYAEAHVAARWASMVRGAGFGAVEIEPFTFCDHTLRPDGLARMLMHLMSSYASQNGHVSADDARAWFEEQEQLARAGRFFFSLTYYRMSAIKL